MKWRKATPSWPPHDVICVFWWDASGEGDGSYEETDLQGLAPQYTCGFLIRENAEHVSIGLNYYNDGKSWRDIQHIPKVNIVKRWVLRKAKHEKR